MAEKRISFCVSCRNRLWQIRQTLARNLALLAEDEEISLADYGSTDGLSEWVWSTFGGAIESRRLVFFEVRNPVTWNSARAKNLAHRVSTGTYLFNLDADNFLNAADLLAIREAAAEGTPSHQWSGTFGDGSFGRIGLPRKLFLALGGYDETLLPMGGQDFDLVKRLSAFGRPVLRLPPPSEAAVHNDMADKVAEVRSAKADAPTAYDTMNRLNLNVSKFRRQLQGPVREGGFASYRGLLNGRPIILDGFDNHHPATTDTDG